MTPPRLVLLGSLAVAFGVLAEVVPWLVTGRAPGALDLAVGLTLLLVALVVRGAGRAGPTPLLLGAAGVAWFLPNLAVTGWAALDWTLDGLSLLHVALLAHACLAAIGIDRRDRVGTPVVVLGYVAAASGLGGPWQVLQPLAAAALVMAALVTARARRIRTGAPLAGVVAACLLGLEQVAGAIARARGGVGAEPLLGTLHDATVIVVAVLLGQAGWAVRRFGGRVDLAIAGRGSIEHAVARIVGASDVRIAFPAADGDGWIDARGERIVGVPGGHDVVADGVPVARLAASRAIPSGVLALLAESLARAGTNARLRRAALDGLDAIAGSRRRVVETASREREVLEHQVRAGPLALLDDVANDLALAGAPARLRVRVEETRLALELVARGLDPVAAAGGLVAAIDDLVTTAPVVVRSTIDAAVDGVTGPPARAIWFTCAEAIANVAKHAGGATVTLHLEVEGGTIRLAVGDDGRGGADSTGQGLRGLAQRAAALGGTLAVHSPPGAGTVVTLTLPYRPTRRQDRGQPPGGGAGG